MKKIDYQLWKDEMTIGAFQSLVEERDELKKQVTIIRDEATSAILSEQKIWQQLAELKANLKSIEWSGSEGYEGEMSCCPACRGLEDDDWNNSVVKIDKSIDYVIGHKSDCWLDRSIKD